MAVIGILKAIKAPTAPPNNNKSNTYKKEVEKLLGNLKKKYVLIIFSFITENKNSKSIYLKNLKMMNNIVETIDINKISKIIFISSVEVYGQVPQNPILESNKENPRNLYGLAKYVCEQKFSLKVKSLLSEMT